MNRKIIINDPNSFDRSFYRRAYPDVRRYKGSLYSHYLKVGVPLNRLPSLYIFRQLYSTFNLKIYRGLSRDLRFHHPEEYYSHFHHIGFDENRYYAFKNKMFINRSRLGYNFSKIGPRTIQSVTCPPGPCGPGGPSGDHRHTHHHRGHRGHCHRHHHHQTHPTHVTVNTKHHRKHKHKHHCSLSKIPSYSQGASAIATLSEIDQVAQSVQSVQSVQPAQSVQSVQSVQSHPKDQSSCYLVLDKNTVDLTNCNASQAVALINHLKKNREVASQFVDHSDNVLQTISNTLTGARPSEIPAREVVNHSDNALQTIPNTLTGEGDHPSEIPERACSSTSLATNAIAWNEIHLLPYARSTNGSASYREFVRYNYSDDGAIVIQQLALPVNEGLEFTTELPQNWKNNSTIIPHVHWTPMDDMCHSYETINLTWMIKSVGDAFLDARPQAENTFAQTIRIGPSNGKVHNKTDFTPRTPTNLAGHNHIVVGQLRRLTEGASYTDDLFIIGLDFNIILE